MSRRYDNHDKSQENAVYTCAKCGDCLVASDSSDNKVCRCDGMVYSATTTENSEPNTYRFNTGSHQTPVKIVVKTSGGASVERKNGGTNNVERKDASTSETPEVYDDKCVSTDSDCKNGSNSDMKHICFSFCHKEDKNKAPCYNKTCPALNDAPKSKKSKWCSKKKDKPTGCPQLDAYFKDLARQGGPSNYAANTIMVPKRENGCGDCCCFDFECCVKSELCNQTRLLNDVMAEVNRSRNDLKDIRECLDCMMRLIRDQSMMSMGKGNCITKMIDDCLECKTCLDRKSKATSLCSREEEEVISKKRKSLESPKRGDEKKWWRCWWPWPPCPWCK